jgi:hypothetical protein
MNGMMTKEKIFNGPDILIGIGNSVKEGDQNAS